MVQSVLGSLALSYRPLWNQARRMAGVRLAIDADENASADAAHLLRTLREMWAPSAPPLLLAARTQPLLMELLQQAPTPYITIEVPDTWLADPALLRQVESAKQRGLRMVWRGALAHLPDTEIASLFQSSVLNLGTEDAVRALQAARKKVVLDPNRPAPEPDTPQRPNPLIPGQMYDNVASHALLRHCLDDSNALAVLGWPMNDVLYSLRHQSMQPSHEVVLRLLKAIDNEQSIDQLEDILGHDPLLAYRFLIHTNSAALGLRTGVDSLRRGLVMVGFGALTRWLTSQLPHASTDPDVRPIREAMVLRARLTERLMEAGIGKDLRSEVYLSGLFAQLDELLQEPIANILQRLPLSERLLHAITERSGPYAASLELAGALENEDPQALRSLCEHHEVALEHVNRSLLRELADWDVKEI